MKFKIMRSKFIEGLKSVQNVVAGRGSLPIIQNVLLEANGSDLRMTTTDLDISIKSFCPCEIAEEGSFDPSGEASFQRHSKGGRRRG